MIIIGKIISMCILSVSKNHFILTPHIRSYWKWEGPLKRLTSAVDKYSDIRNTYINIADITDSETKDWTIEIYVKNNII